MNKAQFTREVMKKKPPNVSESALKIAVESKSFSNATRFQWSDISDTIELAGRLDPGVRELRPQRGGAEIDLVRVGPREIISSDLLCDALQPRIQGLRKRLFGSARPPFRSQSAAQRWIEATLEKDYKKRKRGENTKLKRLLGEFRKLRGPDIRLENNVLEYPCSHKRKLTICRRPVWRGEQLYQLAVESKSIASGAGFSPAAVTAWVLLGPRPVLPRVRISSRWSLVSTGTSGGQIGRNSATLEINASDLTWRELWGIYQRLRNVPNTKRQAVNPLHYRIYQIVRDLGGVPPTGKTVFWEKVQGQLQQEKRKNVPGTWQAIRKAYEATAKRS